MSVIEEVRAPQRTALVRDAAVILGTFLVLGVVGGLLWWQLTPLAEWVRTEDSGTMDQAGLSDAVAVDGWFFVIAAAGGVLAGVLLSAWRTRAPIATVLLITAGACLASAVMYLVGHQLGPDDVDAALRRARVGERVPTELEPMARGVYLAWPVSALLATLAVLWGTRDRSVEPG